MVTIFLHGPDAGRAARLLAPDPQLQDAKDIAQNIRHFLGRPRQASFRRFSYIEKFDYWASTGAASS